MHRHAEMMVYTISSERNATHGMPLKFPFVFNPLKNAKAKPRVQKSGMSPQNKEPMQTNTSEQNLIGSLLSPLDILITDTTKYHTHKLTYEENV